MEKHEISPRDLRNTFLGRSLFRARSLFIEKYLPKLMKTEEWGEKLLFQYFETDIKSHQLSDYCNSGRTGSVAHPAVPCKMLGTQLPPASLTAICLRRLRHRL